jgi:hypothetical protein
MARLLIYLGVMVLSGFFWTAQLLLNYFDYVSSSPYSLTGDFQRLFIYNRGSLLTAELIFPLLMTVAILGLLIVKLSGRPVRWVLVLFTVMGAEFWIWRSFIFKDRIVVYYAQSQAEMPHAPAAETHQFYLSIFVVLVAVVLFVKERSDTMEDHNFRLRRELMRRKDQL